MKSNLISFCLIISCLFSCQKNEELTKNPCNGSEIITVDFEPYPYGGVVQTVPYHLPKQPVGNAFVSVRFVRNTTPWLITLSSEEVTFAEQAFIAIEDYGGSINSATQNNNPDLSVLFIEVLDTLQAYQILTDYEQLRVECEIECY